MRIDQSAIWVYCSDEVNDEGLKTASVRFAERTGLQHVEIAVVPGTGSLQPLLYSERGDDG